MLCLQITSTYFWQWNDNFNQVKISQIERAVNGKRTRVVGRVLRKSVCVRLCVILFDNLYLHHLTSYSSFICYQKRRSSKNNWAPFLLVSRGKNKFRLQSVMD